MILAMALRALRALQDRDPVRVPAEVAMTEQQREAMDDTMLRSPVEDACEVQVLH